jgi:hypothetical protein
MLFVSFRLCTYGINGWCSRNIPVADKYFDHVRDFEPVDWPMRPGIPEVEKPPNAGPDALSGDLATIDGIRQCDMHSGHEWADQPKPGVKRTR